ncbi:MAG: glycosyltransferase family 4 protein [Patescibacteria group bacterium]
MKIGIDISQVVYGTGVSTYTSNLVKNLLAMDTGNEYFLFGGSLRRKNDIYDFLAELSGSNFKSKIVSVPPFLADIMWNRLHLVPIEIFTGKLDVFHSSDWTQPPAKAYKVTTIHDLVPIKFPEYSHPRIVSAHKAKMKWIKKEVNKVIVPSKATQDDVIGLGVDAKRTEIINEAPDPIFKPAKESEIESVKKKYKISNRYLLSVGLSTRKNTNKIIQSFLKIAKNRAYYNMDLVIAGYPYIDIKGADGDKILNHVTQEDMPSLYSGAEVLVYPSLYEGFGLPILESFASGTPVVTSNIGSLKEVAGTAAVLVDPGSARSIALGIKRALEGREDLVKKGVKRVKNFSWKIAAKKTLKVYATS